MGSARHSRELGDDLSRTVGKALVTGASGFIGSHLVEMLCEGGSDCIALVHASSRADAHNLLHLPAAWRDRWTARHGDILDEHDIGRTLEGVDTVFHLAANISVPYSSEAPMLFLQTNALGTCNVLQSCRRAGVARVVVVSSSEVYGGAGDAPLREDDVLCARSPYAASKIAAEKLAESFFHAYDLPVTVVRPFNTFGPRQSERAVIPRIIAQALASGTVALGNVDPQRDFVFVRDTCAGMIAAAVSDNAPGRTLNLATQRCVSIRELVEMIGAILGKSLRIVEAPAALRKDSFEVWKLLGDATRARETIGWSAATPLEDGLRQTVDFYRSAQARAAD